MDDTMNWLSKKRAEWLLLCELWPAKSWAWRLKNIGNFVDDPIDDIKHKLHGIEFMGRKFYLPTWMMQGSGKEDK
jgi:hypothetical protein